VTTTFRTPKISPAIQALIPPLQPDELRQLEANLAADGCRDPLVVWEQTGELLDGHNRYAICTKHRWPFDTVEIAFPDEAAAHAWVIRNQLGRRNLPDAVRVQLALKLKPLLAEKAKATSEANLKRGAKKPEGQISAPREKTRDQVAKIANVSHDTVAKVERVLAKADEPTKAAMLNGSLSINRAHQSVAARKSPIKKPRPEREVLADCAQAIEEAIADALLIYPSLRAAIGARLQVIAQGMRE